MGLASAATGLSAAACCALALAGCGGGGAKPVRRRAGAQAYASCMRDHGVAGFPDLGAAGVAAVKPATRKSPAFITAETLCAYVAPPGSSLHQVTAAEKRRLIAAARCMRSHGAANVPDPSFGAGGAVILDDSGTGSQAPAFRRAAAHCSYPVAG